MKKDDSLLVEVNNVISSPQTEIEDCLDSVIYYHTLQEFTNEYETLKKLFESKNLEEEKYSADYFDLTKREKEIITTFFDDKEGFNKILFAKKYIELAKKPFFKNRESLDWIEEIKKKLYK